MSEHTGTRLNAAAKICLVLLRVAVGWHFLYEGYFKWEKLRAADRKEQVSAGYAKAAPAAEPEKQEPAGATKGDAKAGGPDVPDVPGVAKEKTEPAKADPAKAAAKKDDAKAKAAAAEAPKGWSARGYLKAAKGPLDEYFWNLAEPDMKLHDDIPLVGGKPVFPLLDQVVICTLGVCGALLILGLFTRIACLGAIGMLAMFYISQPPWEFNQLPPLPRDIKEITVILDDGRELHIDESGGRIKVEFAAKAGGAKTKTKTVEAANAAELRTNDAPTYLLYRRHALWLRGAAPPAEGNYFIVNKNLLELIALLVLLFGNSQFMIGLDAAVRQMVTRRFLPGPRAEAQAEAEPELLDVPTRDAGYARSRSQAPDEAPTMVTQPMAPPPGAAPTVLQMPPGSLDAKPGLPISPPAGMVRIQFTCNVCSRPFQADVGGRGEPTPVYCPGCGRGDLYIARPDEQLRY